MRITSYEWRGGREAMLRFGPDHAPTVLAALPPFEEANRTRTAIVDVLRRLVGRGIGGTLADLPGTGESLIPTIEATPSDWRCAFAAAAAALPGPVHVVAWRGAVLLDAEADVTSRWYLAPQSGAALLRDLNRVRELGGGQDYAGNHLSVSMLDALATAEPATTAPLRVVRLVSDPRPADAHLTGPPLWRAAEPTTDAALQQAIADDIADWITRCAG